jgi:hypothetical protein
MFRKEFTTKKIQVFLPARFVCRLSNKAQIYTRNKNGTYFSQFDSSDSIADGKWLFRRRSMKPAA